MALVDTTADTTVDSFPTVQARAGRRRFAALTIFTAFALIAALVFLAVSADGREVSRASSNDGGAWLVNREFAVVGHKNRAAGEISASVRVTDSPTADIFQASGVIVVHDAVTGQLLEVDERAFAEDQQPTQLPEFTSVVAIDDAVLIVRNDPLSLWHVQAGVLRSLATLDGVAPLAVGTGAGLVAATPQGLVAVLDAEDGTLHWFRDGLPVGEPVIIESADDVIDMTIVGQAAVMLDSSGGMLVAEQTGVEHTIVWADVAPGQDPVVRLQQPADAESATGVVGSTAQGQLLEVSFTMPASVTVRASLDGEQPLAPIWFGGCIHAVTTDPPIYGVTCGDETTSRPLAGASQELRLRLVNGAVWVNDLEDGGVWITNDDLEVQRIDDWSLATETESNGEDAEDEGGGDNATSGDELVIEDPDAVGEVQSSDDFSLTEANVPPIAVDDEVNTRVDRSTVVDVLANDSDANNDILVVTVAELISGDARVSVTPSGEEVQVTPSPGFVGRIELSYSISDGESDPVSATVRVQVLPDESQNTAPITTTDVVATAPGNATTIDLLFNDFDAEGDGLALVSVTTETGTLRWDPSGQVTFTPDNNTEAGWIELPYVVVDDRGAEAQGLLRVEIRDDGANQEPDARNDHGSTVVGRPVVLQLLANDSDPDGDPLIVGSRPVLLEPEGAEVQVSVTTDGEFVFSADEPGTYLFSYTVTDSAVGGSESDSARIRIDVADNPLNEPPIAVRDDIVIPRGSTRAVYAIDNDGDPSGDVIAIVDWQSAPGLNIVELTQDTGVIGFLITALPSAPSRVAFNYWISDGVNDPVAAPVIVAVVDPVSTDQPPFAVDDVVEARAGSTIRRLPVLANDFDPEGGALRVVSVGTTEFATVVISPDQQALTIEIPESAVSSFSVPYGIEDQAGNPAAAVARVQLLSADAPNRAPTARTDEGFMQLEATAQIDVLANDSDPDADLISLEGIVQQPANGTARVSADGIVVYRPDDGFTGTDHIRYAIVDIHGARDVGDIFIGVMKPPPANRKPIANDDAYELFGIPTISPLDVLANDADPDGDPIRVRSVSQPDIGSVRIDELGRVEYTPPQRLGEPSAAVFTYEIVDNAGNSDTATVTVSMDPFEAVEEEPPPEEDEPPQDELVEPEPTPDPTPEPTPEPETENEPPVAVNDERGPAAVGSLVLVEVLENDFDPDGDRADLEIIDVGPGATIEGDMVAIVAGQEEFRVTYTIQDADGGTDEGQITLFVIANQAPIVEPLEIATEYETAVELDLAAQVTDADNDELFFACCDNVRGGSIENITSDAGVLTLTFVPDQQFIGGARFSYNVDDQQGHQTSGSVSIDVRPPGNRPPETVDDAISVPQDTFREIDLSTLASDPDDDPLTFEVVEEPGAGIAVQIDGSLATIDVGADVPVQSGLVLVYQAFDGLLGTEGSIDIEVTPIGNEPPVTSDIEIEIPAGASDVVNLALLTTDADSGDPTTWSVDDTTFGRLDVELSGSSLQIRALADATDDTAAISFTATDSRGASADGLVNVVVVAPTAPLPEANNDEASTQRGVPVVLDVLDNDFDPLDDGLTITSATTDDGISTVTRDSIRFTPADGFTGNATVSYTITDAAGRSDTGLVTVKVTAVPDQPAPPDVTGGNRQVLIEWDTPNANGASIDGYRITRFQGTPVCPVSSTVFSTDGACYTLIASLPDGSCPPATTPDPASADCRRAVDLVSGLGLPETVIRPVELGYTWEELENGETYTFTVTAFNAIGDSVPSEPSVEVVPNLKPNVPAAPQVEFGNELITVTWEPPEDNDGSPVDRYQLEIGGELSDVIELGNITTHVWEDLENGEGYNFRVSAGNQAGFSDFSALSPTENPETTPGVPIITSVERGDASGSLVIKWTRPADDGGGEIDNYRVIPSIGDPVGTGDNLTEYEWLDLDTGVPITFQVQAHNRAGWGEQLSAPSVEAIPCGAPGPITWTSAARLDGGAQLVFEEPEFNGCGFGAEGGYVITRTDVVTGDTLIRNTQLTSFPFEPLENGREYSFEIFATNSFGSGVATPAPNPVIPAGPPICGDASNVTAEAVGVGHIEVSWGNATANGRPIDTYQLNIDGIGYTNNNGGAQPAEQVRDLANGTAYTFKLRAVNEVGASLECGEVTATTWDIPTALVATPDFDTVTRTLSWSLSGGDSVDTPITEWEFIVAGEDIVCVDIGGGLESCSYGVVAGPFIHPAASGPIPATVEDEITVEAEYYANARVCNVVGCWESWMVSVPGYTAGLLRPPGPPPQLAISSAGQPLNTAAFEFQTIADRESTARDGLSRLIPRAVPTDDGGSPITSYVWEYRRTDNNGVVRANESGSFPVPPNTYFESTCGCEYYDNPDFVYDESDASFSWKGWNTHPFGPNNAEAWVTETRVAAVNDWGQGDWSDWAVETSSGASPSLLIATGSVSSCSAGPCATFTGTVKLGANQTYTLRLFNIESEFVLFTVTPGTLNVSPTRPCIGGVTTDNDGHGSYSVTCETGEDPTYVRLTTDEGYLSGRQSGQLLQDNTNHWVNLGG